jgi:hypothetical protein
MHFRNLDGIFKIQIRLSKVHLIPHALLVKAIG